MKKIVKYNFTISSTPIKPMVRAKPFIWKPPTGPDPIDPKQYLDDANNNPNRYNLNGRRRSGFVSLDVLPFLKGKRLDQVVIAYVHSLRPSSIRITEGTIKLDCSLWRVTIYVECRRNIRWVKRITQEVEVLLPDGVEHGSALMNAMRYGLNSPEVKWHRDAVSYGVVCGTYYKVTKSGKRVTWKFKGCDGR